MIMIITPNHSIQTTQEAMSIGNIVFTGLFLVEAVLKIAALGPRVYFRVSSRGSLQL